MGLNSQEVDLHFLSRSTVKISGSSRDNGVLAALINENGYYETHLQLFASQYVDTDSICIDIGANIGVHSVMLATLASKGRLIAVEPDPRNLAYLKKNLSTFNNVEIIERGLYSGSDSRQLNTNRSHPAGSFLAETDAHDDDNVEIQLTTLDELVEELGIPRIDFLKIDIEGSEIHALNGGMKTLMRDRPRGVIECNATALRRFQNASSSELFDKLTEIYGVAPQSLEANGTVISILSKRHLTRLIEQRGIVDLVVGIETPPTTTRVSVGHLRLELLRLLRRNRWISAFHQLSRPRFSPKDEIVLEPNIELQIDGADLYQIDAGAELQLTVNIRNLSRHWLSSEFTHPVNLSYRIEENGEDLNGPRTALRKPIRPHGSATAPLTLQAPSSPGQYVCRVSLVQEGSHWFSDLNSDCAISITLHVK